MKTRSEQMRRLGCCMLIMLLITLTTTSVMMQPIKTCAAEQTLPSGVAKSHLEERIDAFVEEHQDTTTGMAVAVFDSADELLKKYYGYVDVENRISVKEDSVFEWGSGTKLLVWVSVMQLYEQGKLALDEDVRHYLPEGFLTNLSYDTPVTMLNLMDHNAGFQELYVDVFVTDADCYGSLGEVMRKYQPAQVYEPGTVMAYSNWGVALAGLIVEQISGKSFSEYVHENIFEPLHMEHSAVFMDLSDNEWVLQRRKELQCYTTDGELIPDCFYYITLYPAGMCTSTLDDFERFARALLREDAALLKDTATWEELYLPSAYFGKSDIPLNCHGFWMVPFGVRTIGHGGNTAGCSSYLLLDREDQVGAVVMTNQSNEKVYNTDMMELIFGKYERSDYTEEDEIPPGGFTTARTVHKGPFKIMGLSYRTGTDAAHEDELWIFDDSGKQNKIVYSYGDYVQISLLGFLVKVGMVCLWLIVVGFSAISLVVRGIILLVVRLSGKKTAQKKLGKWSAIAALLQMGGVFFLILIINCISNYALGDTYMWMFAALGIIAVMMDILCVYGLFRNNKGDKQFLKVRQRVFNNITAGFLVVTVVNVLYWNLFMFWSV